MRTGSRPSMVAHMLVRAFHFLASLRLTVALLAMSIVLVFFGTLGQVNLGLYEAHERYFKSWLVLWQPVSSLPIPVPLPAGYLLGTSLLVNLLAAHFKRFKFTWKKSGILLTHVGIILLLAPSPPPHLPPPIVYRTGRSPNHLHHPFSSGGYAS